MFTRSVKELMRFRCRGVLAAAAAAAEAGGSFLIFFCVQSICLLYYRKYVSSVNKRKSITLLGKKEAWISVQFHDRIENTTIVTITSIIIFINNDGEAFIL